jgi:hypothetical protein
MNDSARQRPLTVIRHLALFFVAAALAACTPAPGPSGSGGNAGSGSSAGGSGGSQAPRGGSGGPSTGGGQGSSGGSGGSSNGGSGGSATTTGGTGGSSGQGGAGGTVGNGGSQAGAGGAGATSGTGGSGGGGGSGSGDGGAVDQPPSNPAGCSAKFCDDFEAFNAGAAPAGNWTPSLSRGMLAVDETKAFSGARSVHLTHQGAPAVMFMQLRQPVLPMAGNIVYGRLMYYMNKSPTGQYSHYEIVRGGGVLSGTSRAQLNTGAENGKVVVNYEPGDCTKYSKVAFPEKKWTCYQFRFDGTKNDIHLWVDGVSVDDVPVAPAGGGCWRHPMALDTLYVGWESYHSNQPVELWIDDVAVGDQMIPCPTGPPSKP